MNRGVYMENNENIIVLSDENGEETKFEVVTVLEVEDNDYYVQYPVDSEEEDAIVLKLVTNEAGEDVLTTIDDDDEFDKVAEVYEEWLESEEDEEILDDDEDQE
jgi:uncharacterized protein YrzB (UPF0473 family)